MAKWFVDFFNFKDNNNQQIIKDLDKKNKELVKEINNKGIKCIYKDYSIKWYYSKIYKFFGGDTDKDIKKIINNLNNNEIFIFIVINDKNDKTAHQICVTKIDNKLFTMNVYTDYIKYLSDKSRHTTKYCGTLNIENYDTFVNILPKSFSLNCSDDESTYGYPCAFYANYFANFLSNNIDEKEDDFINKIKAEFGTNGSFEKASEAEHDRIIEIHKKNKKTEPRSQISFDANNNQDQYNDDDFLLISDDNPKKTWIEKLAGALQYFNCSNVAKQI